MNQNARPIDTLQSAFGESSDAQTKNKTGCLTVCVLVVLVLHTVLLAWGAFRHSPTIDEVRWLPAGIVHCATGRFDVGRANPPLVRMVAALPVLLAHSKTEREVGKTANVYRDFIELNGARSVWLFTLGRWACIPFSLIGGYVCYRWGRELYGAVAGIVALILWCFSPNILAHAQIVAHDAPAAALGITAGYAFWKWLRGPTWERTFLAGLFLGLAQLTKMTLVVFFGLWPVLWIVWWASSGKGPLRPTALKQSAQLLVLLAIGLYVLNLGYVFEGSCRLLKDYKFSSMTLNGGDQGVNGFADTWFGNVPVPFPAQYVLGIDQVKADFEGRNIYAQTYLRGQWRDRGLWYYFLYALGVKVPLGTWCLFVLALALRILRLDGLRCARDEWLLIPPALTILILASSRPDFTDHLRYILPMFPFMFVWISRVGRTLTQRGIVSLAAACALAWSIGSSLWIYPHSLSYFNELAGGPRNGHFHLVSSNIDYGQDLLYLKEWLDDHPEARPFHLALWNQETFDPAIIGIENNEPPSGPQPEWEPPFAEPEKLGPQPGWHAANVNVLRGDAWPSRKHYPGFGYYGYLLNFEQVAMAGYSIYIYHISLDEANRARQRMNLPPIAQDE